MDGFIANHGKGMGARRDKNQHAVMTRRFVHAEPQKFLLRFGHGVFDMFVTDENANFAGGFLFGFAQRINDVVVAQIFFKFPWMHKSPMPSRAAAAEASAAPGKSPAAREPAASRKPATTPASASAPTAAGIKHPSTPAPEIEDKYDYDNK